MEKQLTLAFIGEIVGRPGRSMVKEHLKKLREEFGVDFVIANYENASHGFGLTTKNAQELFGAGIDVMTGGNHSFDKKEIASLFETPINYRCCCVALQPKVSPPAWFACTPRCLDCRPSILA